MTSPDVTPSDDLLKRGVEAAEKQAEAMRKIAVALNNISVTFRTKH